VTLAHEELVDLSAQRRFAGREYPVEALDAGEGWRRRMKPPPEVGEILVIPSKIIEMVFMYKLIMKEMGSLFNLLKSH